RPRAQAGGAGRHRDAVRGTDADPHGAGAAGGSGAGAAYPPGAGAGRSRGAARGRLRDRRAGDHHGQRAVTQSVPVCRTVMVAEARIEYVPTVQSCQVTEYTTRQVPFTVPVTTYTTQARQVTENATRQVPYQVPFTVPVTTYTTQARQV